MSARNWSSQLPKRRLNGGRCCCQPGIGFSADMKGTELGFLGSITAGVSWMFASLLFVCHRKSHIKARSDLIRTGGSSHDHGHDRHGDGERDGRAKPKEDKKASRTGRGCRELNLGCLPHQTPGCCHRPVRIEMLLRASWLPSPVSGGNGHVSSNFQGCRTS